MGHGHCKKQKDGRRESLTYTSWRMMVQRCTNENRKDYDLYGGRGILVYFGWLGPGGFQEFLQDVGLRPSLKHSLDRIDPDGNYDFSNVRWATKSAQNSNKSGYVVEFGGERLTTYEWAERLGLHPGALRKRFSRGWTRERALGEANRRGKNETRKRKRRSGRGRSDDDVDPRDRSFESP